MTMFSVVVLKEGYSTVVDGVPMANSTSTLITGNGLNIVVDTLSAWDKNFLMQSLQKNGLTPDDINYVVCTHGHCDHIGNLNLFTSATYHIVGFSIHKADKYYIHPFEAGEKFEIADGLYILPTPGHTKSDVSVIVQNEDHGVIAIAGDIFEKEEDIRDFKIWKDEAGSEDPVTQYKSRQKLLDLADYIIPGHGKGFKVTEEMRKIHRELEML